MTEKNIKEIELDDILPNRFQPRIKFNQEALIELANSIKEHGVIQPVIVREIGDKYEIIAGERRYKASVLAGKTTIPAIIHNVDDTKSSEIALIENIQRQDLTAIEEAASYRKILELGSLTQQQLAEKVDKKQSTISNKLRLLNLSDEAQEALLNEQVSERHARSLLKIEDEKQQVAMLNRVINERLTVRQTDVEIEKLQNKGEQMEETVEILEDIISEEKSETSAQEPDYNFEEVKNNPGFMDVDQMETNAQDIYVEPVAKDWDAILKDDHEIEDEMKENLKSYGIDVDFSKNLEEKEDIPQSQESAPLGRFFNFETHDEEVKEEAEPVVPKEEFNFQFQGNDNPNQVLKEKVKNKIAELKLTDANLEIEELDLDDQYQFIIKIKKD